MTSRYVRRRHDDAVARVVDAARGGAARVLTLVGPPCSGRTRTVSEALRCLPDLWRVWRPDGDPAVAVAAAGPYTVVWLTDPGPLLVAATAGADRARRRRARPRRPRH